jgi:hypothetical protein
MEHAKREPKQKIASKKLLLKVNLCFILPLALGAIIDLHVELRCTAMVVEKHEETLMQLMIFCKLGPSTPEVHLALPIVVHLHFIGSASPRLFTEDCFMKLTPNHELGEFQRNMLYLMALSAGDAEEGVDFGRSGRRNITRSSSKYLGFVLTPHMATRTPLYRCGR